MAAGSTFYEIKVPATSANLGPGYDCLGVAFDLNNRFIIELQEPGQYDVSADGPEGMELQLHPENNMVAQAFNRGWELSGDPAPVPGLKIRIDTHIPTTRGLGSSSSAVVAGTLAGFHAATGRLEWPLLLEAMTAQEGHPDNVLPAALGGMVCGAWSPGHLDFVRRRVAQGLVALAYVPDTCLPTRQAREAIPAEISHKDAVFNAARTPLVTMGLMEGNLELLAHAMHDKLHQPYRRGLISAFDQVEKYARENELPFAISGAGPTMLLWSYAEQVEEHLVVFRAANPELDQRGRFFIFKPNNYGFTSPQLEPCPHESTFTRALDVP
jgi:homoserine kinase